MQNNIDSFNWASWKTGNGGYFSLWNKNMLPYFWLELMWMFQFLNCSSVKTWGNNQCLKFYCCLQDIEAHSKDRFNKSANQMLHFTLSSSHCFCQLLPSLLYSWQIIQSFTGSEGILFQQWPVQAELQFNKGCGFSNYYLRLYYYQSKQFSALTTFLHLRTSAYGAP